MVPQNIDKARGQGPRSRENWPKALILLYKCIKMCRKSMTFTLWNKEFLFCLDCRCAKFALVMSLQVGELVGHKREKGYIGLESGLTRGQKHLFPHPDSGLPAVPPFHAPIKKFRFQFRHLRRIPFTNHAAHVFCPFGSVTRHLAKDVRHLLLVYNHSARG